MSYLYFLVFKFFQLFLVINIVLLGFCFYHVHFWLFLCCTFLSAVLDSQKMPTKSLLSGIYWCFNYPAGIQTLLCFSAAALKVHASANSTKSLFLLLCSASKPDMGEVIFSESVCFPVWWIVSFLLLQASFGKTIFLPMQKIPYVRQLPVDFSSLLFANGFMLKQFFSLSMQTFSGQLRACLCSTGGLSSCPGALHCCRAAAWALHSCFSSDKSTPLMWISSVSPHTAPHLLWQHSCRQHKLHFISDEMKPEYVLQGCSWHELQLLMGI